ncbi:MAG: nickel pincer cofactor biosynthesis protein LarC [Treponema sp.]|nr:nickel pincer cofactor biosynthesis protein LarC [Treponema sp.]
MKTLYFECTMGAAGDMLLAALLELHENPGDFLQQLNSAGIPGVKVTAESSIKCGIKGTHVSVKINGQEEHAGMHSHDHAHDHEHNHGSFHDIEHLIGHLHVGETVKNNAIAIYKLIAEAESHVHGVPVHQIHFHEVGEMDAVADIVGVCMLMEYLAPDVIISSPVNTGSGHVRCAHGVLPVPAPAAAFILRNVPVYNDQSIGELCTPTGAAILKHFVKEFRTMPQISVSQIGYGMGKKNFEKANCVRAFLGETGTVCDEVMELVCNLDDMTPESVAFAQQLLLDEGALDVYTIPIGMKKGRMGLSFVCMCLAGDKEKMVSLIFRHTSTLGIREYTSRRYALQKEQTEVQTKFGSVKVKTSFGYGVKKTKPEYEDIAGIARKKSISLQDVLETLDL